MSHVRLFEHPSKFGAGIPVLAIEGSFRSAEPGLAYEGRLQIVNAGGACTVEKLSGALPLGASLYIDNATKEIVVTWPAYEANAAPIINPGLEDGDAGWEMGPGWSATTDNPPSGLKSMQYLDHGGNAAITNTARAVITPGTHVNASCKVRQGASSSGNAGAAVRLEFRDAADGLVAAPEGNMVSSGSNNEVLPSNLSTVAPAGATSVAIGALGFRKRQNKKVWVDDFAWDVTQPSVGTSEDQMWCISLRVRDALGREADWEGCIDVHGTYHRWWLAIEGRSYLYVTDDPVNGPWEQVLTNKPSSIYQIVATGRDRAFFYLPGSSSVTWVAPSLSHDDGSIIGITSNIGHSTGNWAFYNEERDLLFMTKLAATSYLYSEDGGVTSSLQDFPYGSALGSVRDFYLLPNDVWAGGCRTGSDWKGYKNGSDIPLTGGWSVASSDPLGATGGAYFHCQLADGTVLAFANSSVIQTTDGNLWTTRATLPVSVSTDTRCAPIVTENGTVVWSMGQDGDFLIGRNNGTTWTETSIAAFTPLSMYAHDGIIVASGLAGGVRASLDGGDTFIGLTLPEVPGGACCLAPLPQ